MLRHIKTTAPSTAASRVTPNSTAKWTITPRRQFGTLFQIQRHQLNNSPLSRFAFNWEKNKLTLDKGERLKFWVQQQQARSFYHNTDIIYGPQFNTIDWEMVYTTLCCVPCRFQIWACKQVMDIAPANGNRQWEQNLCLLCPSCAQVNETCLHLLFCNHVG
jgi:hypothetical protein